MRFIRVMVEVEKACRDVNGTLRIETRTTLWHSLTALRVLSVLQDYF